MTRNREIPHLSNEDKDYIRSRVIHEDDAVIAFNKPSGLPSQVRGNRARNLDHLLWAFAKSNGKRPRLVHRLDAGTSGVIIAGKTKPATVALSAAFEQRTALKTYVALCKGSFQNGEEGVIDAPIARIETDRGTQVVAGHADGKPAQTHWTIFCSKNGHAFLILKPRTGRMHQIRVHLKHKGWPILGDRIYGRQESAPRLMLHAHELNIPHPDGGQLSLKAKIPDNFIRCAEEHKLLVRSFGMPRHGR